MRIDLELAIGVLNGAVGDYLKRERTAMAREIALLGAESPYRKQ